MEEVYEVVIIGSGPSGLTAGIYASRANLKTLILAGSKWGGQLMLTTEVENFPGFPKGTQGPELMHNIREQAVRFGSKVIDEDVDNVDFSKRPFEVTARGQVYKAQSVIVATGAATKWLGLPSEEKLIGRGVSSCAPCDAPFFKDKNVAVTGGGDAAMEEALVLSKYASSVTLIHRRDEFKASKIMQDRVMENPKIKRLMSYGVEEILGDTKVTGIKLKNLKTNEIVEMPFDGVFVAIGHEPATKIFQGKIELDEKGYAKVKSSSMSIDNKYPSMSNVEGVFVSGDVFDFHYRQAITAAGYGCMAAMDASKWLEDQGIGKGAATR